VRLPSFEVVHICQISSLCPFIFSSPQAKLKVFLAIMTAAIYIAVVAVLGFYLYRLLYGTDTPHIKRLPEIPGLPLFGSLRELGTNHARVAQGWAKKYGPVFQARLGNRVCYLSRKEGFVVGQFQLTSTAEDRLCQLVRFRSTPLDHEPVRSHLTSHASHLPHGRILLARFHNRHVSMG
jgi:hypothetical protein